ncbi:formate dehydrogenase accessory sulfurtransferase FdhD [Zavarzinia aquatilis]|uniref:Sulfur carrier protein FdhD n=1 Tax=Zavarzinia aquatilis TaxID=2211142 RepID=A0A317DUV4_9PROT|nr:formate dehydrogenase accessory sulfurtransferase FdhD [Zavarzinia aquatilis]PWR18467.1 formate dehydrogenase accessory sulfurtransferase FdhD [Zavarzinia aquatilis]
MDAAHPDQDTDDRDTAQRHAALVERACLRRDGDAVAAVGDILANEVAIALVYNGVSHAVMMASPLDLEDFAIGFSLAEGIVATASELRDIARADHDRGISLDIEIPAARFARLKERRRALTGRTGCGLCGIDSLDEALRPPPRVVGGPKIAAGAIARAMAGLAAGQVLNRESHAVHAAGWAGREGDILLLREDVGRHNAVDKLTGALARQGIDPADGFLAVTSRCSFEIVHKAATAGIAVIASVSAPTDYAVRLAEEAGITLIAFARGQRHSIYSRPERLIP